MWRVRLVGVTTLRVRLLLTSVAFAAEASRDEYKAAVEPICKKNTKANERILAGVEAEVRAGKLKSAAASSQRLPPN